MERSKCFIFLTLVFVRIIGSYSELNTEDYVNLILDVYDIYKPPSVLLIHFVDIQRISDITIIFEMELILTQRKILTQVIQFEEMQLLHKYSNFSGINEVMKRTQLGVLLLTTGEALQKLNKSLEHLKLHQSINLVLFMTEENPFHKVCTEFGPNFRFNFHQLILVKCYGDKKIQLWHLENSETKELSTWGVWEPHTRLILKRKDSFSAGWGNFKGKVLRIATVKSSCLTQWKDGKLVGYLADLLIILEELMNFQTKHIKEENEFGIWNESSQTWTGAMGLIVNGEVDLIVSDLSMTSNRLRSVDFSAPLFSSETMLFFKLPSNERAIIWSGYFMPFSYKIWIVIILILLISPLVLTVMKMNGCTSYKPLSLISESYLNVWGIFCQQGLKEFPTRMSLRVAYLSIFVSSFIILTLYSASLISNLAVPTSSIPFSTLEGFVKDASYKLVVIKDGSDYDMFTKTNDSTLRNMNKLMLIKNKLPSTVQEAFNLVCNSKTAFYDSEILAEIGKNNISCQLVKISTGRYDTTGMVLRKGSPYRKAINYYLAKLRSKGILNHLRLKYFSKMMEPKFDTFNTVSLRGIVTLLIIIAGGFLLSLIILILEKIYYTHKLNNQLERPISILSINL